MAQRKTGTAGKAGADKRTAGRAQGRAGHGRPLQSDPEERIMPGGTREKTGGARKRKTAAKKDPKLAPRLTDKQENFLLKLLETDNQRLAYRCAYNCARMSDRSVDTEASKLLKNPKVALRFEKLKEAARKRSSLQAEDRAARVLAELEEIAFHDPDVKVRDRLKALELLGKSEQLYTDRVKVDPEDNRLEVVVKTVTGDADHV